MPRNRQAYCYRSIARCIAVLVVAVSSKARGEAIIAQVALAQASTPTLDLQTLEPGVLADVYHVSLTNPNELPVTSLQLELSGPWLNNFSPRLLQSTPDLPTLLGHPVAETYFVFPDSASDPPISIGGIDTDQLLSASYTFSGDRALIEAGETAVVAVLSVPAGFDPVPGLLPVFGQAVVDGVFECVGYPGDCFPLVQHPEPSTLVLAALALVTVGRRV